MPLGFGDAGVGFGGRLEGATEVGTVVVGTLVIGTADDDTDVIGPLEDEPVGVGTLDEAVPDAPPDPASEDPVSDEPALDDPALDEPRPDEPLADSPSVPASPPSVPEPDPPLDVAPESARLVAVTGSDPCADDPLAIAAPVGVAASLLEQADSISDPANAAARTGRRRDRPERAVVKRMEDLC